MIGKNTLLASLLLSVGLYSAQAYAVVNSGWNISSSYVWRLLQNSDYAFEKGSSAKILQIDKKIMHRQAVFKVQKSITNKYAFKVGCMYQSKTPAFELDTTTLDIAINDTFKGYVFARFLVDKGQEYSLRAEIIPPSRLVFAPLTKTQDTKLSDLFMQLSEGGVLQIALLQGPNQTPRFYQIPLEGFFDLSKTVMSDCNKLNSMAQNHRGKVKFLPDYLTREPDDAAPKDFSLKPKRPNDGLTPPPAPEPPKVEEVKEEAPVIENPKVEEPEEEEQTPEVQLFSPGGGVASIGEDGKPITEDTEGSIGESKGEMKIGEDGAPVSE